MLSALILPAHFGAAIPHLADLAGAAAQFGLHLPDLNIYATLPPRHPAVHIPPTHAFKPTHRFGPDLPFAALPLHRQRLPRRRRSY